MYYLNRAMYSCFCCLLVALRPTQLPGSYQGRWCDGMIDRNPAPTHLPKQGIFYIPQHIGMLWDRLAFDRGVSLHTLGSENGPAWLGGELTTCGSPIPYPCRCSPTPYPLGHEEEEGSILRLHITLIPAPHPVPEPPTNSGTKMQELFDRNHAAAQAQYP